MGTITKSQKILIMTGVIFGMLLSALDQTTVGTAMPRIVSAIAGQIISRTGIYWEQRL